MGYFEAQASIVTPKQGFEVRRGMRVFPQTGTGQYRSESNNISL